ncbi:hypothetical protein R0G64_30505 [Pseudomonas otitidis]|uniref:Uncharacterized protein n=1 Tax=Metapseudomonas otitidis TaxID=319939 RepID=A0ABU3Y174_9GAMM|nr:hypothetical protein [Pseudomonas otitidis]MDV3443754.1 hypothetical protein [Pseudomonas otitidis]
MFERIICCGHGLGITTATYEAGDVQGMVSFSASETRTCVMSTIGPINAILDCVLTHRHHAAPGRRVVIGEQVMDCS